MSFLSAFGKVEAVWKSVAAVWPAVDSFVKQVESAFPTATIGSVKLAAVKSMLQAAWGTVDGIVADFEAAWPTLEALIGALVTAYNAVGIFNHKPATPAA